MAGGFCRETCPGVSAQNSWLSRCRGCACCSAGSLDTLTVLEAHKVDVNIAAQGVTALHAAAEAGELECAQILLKVFLFPRMPPAFPRPGMHDASLPPLLPVHTSSSQTRWPITHAVEFNWSPWHSEEHGSSTASGGAL